jgi:hypothetical protein
VAFTVLDKTNSFNPGAELWVIPELSESKAAPRLDWYMNFQISKSQRMSKPNLAHPLLEILSKTKLNSLQFVENSRNGILYPTEKVLPNRWVLMLPNASPVEKWCERIVEKWQGLQKPTLRIFLPQGQTAKSFENAWYKFEKFDDLSLVLD